MTICILPPRENFPSDLTRVEGGQRKVATSDVVTRNVLQLAMLELQKVNVQLALMNDTVLNTGDSL